MKDFAANFGKMIHDLLTSKKFMASALTFLAGMLIKDAGLRDKVIELGMVYVGGQAVVDHAQAKAAAPAPKQGNAL